MAKVLVIKTSMMGANSISNVLNDKFMEYYKEKNPNDEFIYMNLNDEKMASITMTSHNMKEYFVAEYSDKYINQLKKVDKVVMSVPMTNFNVNAVTKNYLDHISVADKTFSYKYSKKGEAIGLLDHLSVQILTTQGAPLGWYPWGNHSEYLKGHWRFLGAKVADHILVDSVKIGENSKKTPQEIIEKFDGEIKKAAYSF
ncbi:ACYL CARRIER PROTEIN PHOSPHODIESTERASE (ACP PHOSPHODIESTERASE) [Mycoplasmopsis pulmonis]|uniref:FMN-dependent NADH:quinone oxidoreductase n=1 Tax=Mycoplasmopsis pulmonis (strain UAB CTIP) TaxID=272635 RepID=AZOR_MYCPU|nr:FMN-dependent NADH-azoreductase [Mycoplasmopsis pulmonis]Q98QP9.1 RecName: Full=FMN-dependent NADH:quinone oxidoreductase; AltName: Full=Azo-dye reductase; AltName: Full=FMN-dependent NADH-azo compound oxidoreductase; AltName: Full=FMN-dependent NADH-azoreductase [Mycoplasmopsis pulmonis UAB CTIP]MDZ7293272.1 FMN-dependent NADH-azoreductase [Mycoplasmopsis pulmonis]CAC13485.1 ACYL CARRIER PROTEIN PHOSPHODIESTERASE (ACP PHOSPHODIESTERASE) [Mycoplasmopsis pulmonis]